MGLYLYGVVGIELCPGLWTLGQVGVPDSGLAQKVEAVVSDGLAMLASPLSSERVLPVRRNLEAHHRVLRAVHQLGTIVPMKFGHLASSTEAVLQLLQLNSEALHLELARLSGRAEMGLQVRWDVENIYEHFVEKNSMLRQARDRLFAPGAEPSRDDRIELGRLFEQVCADERRDHTDRLLSVLEGVVEGHVEGPIREARTVANLAVLFERSREPELRERVLRAAERLDDGVLLGLDGPWPPLSFVELEVRLPGSSRPAHAGE